MLKTRAAAVHQLRYHWLCRNRSDSHRAWSRASIREAVLWLRQYHAAQARTWFQKAGRYFDSVEKP